MNNDEKPFCPICIHYRLETARFSKKIQHKGSEIEVAELECWLCLECGAMPVFADQQKRNDKRLKNARRRFDDVASPPT